ncbi:alpha/beta hydrolase family esterase [Roseinatronobacter alkalisoli]|uniref:PHB depolymerase family esterase n=1 Tax=Roseinatronobacter alkalisoli TaxID=3028235 RepID=A0ABT5TBM6_9RHOB|nr:PHB depolymerase family esterase [Roseinatronobacter sp. HJB301]MDD7972349.1 PHB depolymerase family esterase [Roseinatronobacter sp. HJB301]
MSTSLAASMRRNMRHLRGQAKAVRKTQKAVAITVVNAAYAPLTAFNAKVAKQRKVRKQAVGRSLGVAVNQLRAGQPLMPAAFASTGQRHLVPKVPDGARYLTRRYRCMAGARRYKLYLPASQPKQPKGLIIMLHGCRQSPDNFAAGTHMNQLAEKHGLAIAYPQQTRQNNAALCWNWFRPGDQAKGSGEPAILAALTRKLMKELGVGRDRTFVAGLSAGGAMAAILVDEYPEVFAGAGIHSGLARGAANDVISAMSAMRNGSAVEHTPAIVVASRSVRRIIFHGGSDSTVHPSNAVNIVTAALGKDAIPSQVVTRSVRGRAYIKSTYPASAGAGPLELWSVTGAGHAWSGGRKSGSYTDSRGPDASAQMIRFFLAKPA